jgi:DNA-binding NarL/FixJ family response regulator
MSKRIKIAYAEDHTLVRQTCIAALNSVEDFNVISEAANGLEMLKLIRKSQPDVLISDIQMPEMDGFELAKVVNKEYPDIKIIFLSSHYSSFFESEAIEAGVNGFLPKEIDFETLCEAIRRVYKEGYYLNPLTNKSLISKIMTANSYQSVRNQLTLSEREKEILSHLCNGKSNKEIAESLFVTSATVDFHRQSIYKKTEISSVALLVKYAIKNGITSLD